MNADKIGSAHRRRRSLHVRLSSARCNGLSLNISSSTSWPIGDMQAALIAPARIERGVNVKVDPSRLRLRNVISDWRVRGYG